MLELLTAMFVFSLTMSISPGPVNMAILSSGANHGVWRTMPFVSGATIGFTLLLVAVGFLLAGVVAAYPRAFVFLEVAGAAFIMYVGYKIAASVADLKTEERSTQTFSQGFLLQWLNPKAWIAAASGSALFSRPESHATLVAFIVIYFTVCYLSLAAWAVLGERVALVLTNRKRMRIFNIMMGGSLIVIALQLMWTQVASHLF
jgi:threonine/homoserine/homoserine lactone efflux protein